jgi:hypothetical protein
VADGIGADGTGYKTKIDLTHLSPDATIRATNVKVLFFRSDGTPWTVATNVGTISEYTIALGAFQTMRIETLGTSPSLTAGYVIVRNLDLTTIYAEDYDVAVSAFYEVSKGGNVIDTVSVSVSPPTVVWIFPAQMDAAENLLTGFAIANLESSVNSVTLRLFPANADPSQPSQLLTQASILLGPNEKRAVYLNDSSLFPNANSFKGTVLGFSGSAVAILALLQTPTPNGVQYATLAPTLVDSLRRNTYMYLRQGYTLDADLPVSDYFGAVQDSAPWDLIYQPDQGSPRTLTPQSGAAFAVIGVQDTGGFDALTIGYLRGLNYTTNSIDMSDGSPNLALNFTFAIRTGLGRYVKLRIADIISAGSNIKDLALEMYIYK